MRLPRLPDWGWAQYGYPAYSTGAIGVEQVGRHTILHTIQYCTLPTHAVFTGPVVWRGMMALMRSRVHIRDQAVHSMSLGSMSSGSIPFHWVLFHVMGSMSSGSIPFHQVLFHVIGFYSMSPVNTALIHTCNRACTITPSPA